MKQNSHPNRLQQIGGYLLIPHELVHLLGFRLVGKRCRYRWGQFYVTPLEPMTRGEHLVGVLLPFVAFFPLLILCALLAGFAAEPLAREGQWLGFVFWLLLTYIAGFYTCTALGDLRKAYLLIRRKPWHSRTPFDVFFYPIVDWDDLRQKTTAEETDVQSN